MPSRNVFQPLGTNRSPTVEDINAIYRLLNGDFDSRKGHGMSVRLTAFDGVMSTGLVDVARYALEVRNREESQQRTAAFRRADNLIVAEVKGGLLRAVEPNTTAYPDSGSSYATSTTTGQVVVHGTPAGGVLGGTYPNPTFATLTEYYRVYPKMIVAWYGSSSTTLVGGQLEVTDCPGWVFCHGQTVTLRSGATMATPDMRDRIPMGAGTSYSLGDTDGNTVAGQSAISTAHTHTGAAHTHPHNHPHHHVHNHTTPNHTHTVASHGHNHSHTFGHTHTVPVPNHAHSHNHDASSGGVGLTMPNHSHAAGTLTMPQHTHTLSNHSHTGNTLSFPHEHNHSHDVANHDHTITNHIHEITHRHNLARYDDSVTSDVRGYDAGDDWIHTEDNDDNTQLNARTKWSREGVDKNNTGDTLDSTGTKTGLTTDSRSTAISSTSAWTGTSSTPKTTDGTASANSTDSGSTALITGATANDATALITGATANALTTALSGSSSPTTDSQSTSDTSEYTGTHGPVSTNSGIGEGAGTTGDSAALNDNSDSATFDGTAATYSGQTGSSGPTIDAMPPILAWHWIMKL